MKVQLAGKFAIATLVTTLASSAAFAAGFEKNVMWGARWAGVGGAGTAAVSGADALYYNPAGLAAGGVGQEVSANFSPTWSQYEGKFTATGAQMESETTFSPIFGLIYGARLNEKFGFGVGGYVSAGSRSEYDSVELNPAFAVDPTIKSMVQAVEIAAGAGYEVMPGLRVGAAWRVALVSGELSTTGRTTAANPLTTYAAQLEDLEDTQWNGFRLGAQYAPTEIWGLGFSVRTPLKFDLEGDLKATTLASGASVATTGGSASSELPTAWTLSGYYDFVPQVWRGYLEWVFTQYGNNETLDLGGTVGGSELSDITLDWKDQHNIRVGAEFMRTKWPVRAGYVFTTQVTPADAARPTFAAPGEGHTVTLGTGTTFMEDRMKFNAAAEYSWITGDDIAVGTGTGDFSTKGYTLHLGLAYNF